MIEHYHDGRYIYTEPPEYGFMPQNLVRGLIDPTKPIPAAEPIKHESAEIKAEKPQE
jgi:hypothetical protein